MSEQSKPFPSRWILAAKNSVVIFLTSRELTKAELDALIAAYRINGYHRRIGKNLEVKVLVADWEIEAAVNLTGR